MMNVLARISTEIGLRNYVVLDTLAPQAAGPLTDFRGTFDRAELRRRVDAVGAEFVTCCTADRRQVEVLRPVRAFHVIRDPRDIIVSAYFSNRNSLSTEPYPHIQRHRAELRNTSLEQGLLLEMEFSKAELVQIGDWDYTHDHILEVKAEDLLAHPYEGFISIFRHLGLLGEVEPQRAHEQLRVSIERLRNRLSRRTGLERLRRRIPATGEIVLGTVYAQRFDALTGGRQRGNEDVESHYRKGVAGDWANYFTAEHVDAFNEQFGDLLVKLGYEENRQWSSLRAA